MLQKINKLLEKLLPILTPISVVTGVIFATYLTPYYYLVPWIFALMTFSGSLNINFNSLQRTITHPFPIIVSLLTLHLIMPAWAWSIGHLIFPNDDMTITGLILGVVLPTGITSFIWVSMKQGNTSLGLSIILIDTLLSPFVLPYSLAFFVGSSISMDIGNIVKGLLYMIVLPSILGMIVNNRLKETSNKVVSSWLSPFSKIGIFAVVMINSAKIAPYLQEINLKLISIAVVVFFIVFSGFLVSWGIAKLVKMKHDIIVTLIFTGGMRNIGAGVVIAVSFFPAKVAVPVVIGMLYQQMLASFYGSLISKSKRTSNIQHIQVS